MAKFRKKPVVIEAVQWLRLNSREMAEFLGESWGAVAGEVNLEIRTLEGTMTALPNDWMIKGVKGEFYPCKPDIFAETYEAGD